MFLYHTQQHLQNQLLNPCLRLGLMTLLDFAMQSGYTTVIFGVSCQSLESFEDLTCQHSMLCSLPSFDSMISMVAEGKWRTQSCLVID